MKRHWATLLTGLLLGAGCRGREQPVDEGALLTARTVGLDDLQRGRLSEAEREFKQMITLAPRDASGYADLGLTYLRAGRFDDAEAQLKRARRLDPKNPDIALITARLYAVTGRRQDARQVLEGIAAPDARVLFALAELERQGADSTATRGYVERLREVLAKVPTNLAVRLRLADALLQLGEADSTIRYLEEARAQRPEPPREAKPHLERVLRALHGANLSGARAELDRFLRMMDVTAPYQAALAAVNWVEGPLTGRPDLSFNPASLITMRGIRPAGESAAMHFSDVTAESGLPDIGAAPTALALGDYNGDGVDELLLAWIDRDRRPQVRLFTLSGGFVADVTQRVELPLPAGAIAAAFADYDNDGWLDVFAIGTNHRGYLLHNLDGKRFSDVSDKAGVRQVNGATHVVFADLDHDGDLDLLLVGRHSLTAYRNNLDGTFAPFPKGEGLEQAGDDAAFADFDGDGRTDVFVAGASGDLLLHNNGSLGFSPAAAASGERSTAVAAGDYDNDGAIDLLVTGPRGASLWHNDGAGRFTRDTRASALARLRGMQTLTFVDYDNDGWLDVLAGGPGGLALLHNDGHGRFEDRRSLIPAAVARDSIGSLLVSDLDGDGDQDVLLAGKSGVHQLRNDGGNAHLGMSVQLSALGAGSGKNNSYGIGSTLEVRAGALYQTRVVTSRVTPFGLGPHFKADVLRVEWTNGVPQTIYFPGTDEDVLELQQLKGSCAFLYTWDGKRFEFARDFMWRSALGMPLGIMGGSAAYAPAQASQEYVRLPDGALAPRDGKYVVQVTEELWETAYVDQLRLLVVDHPDSEQVFVDERFPPASGGLRLYRVSGARPPLAATDDHGRDVLDEVRRHDDRFVAGLVPDRYQGLTEPHALILNLDSLAGGPGSYLFLRGWIYPTDASINVALSQQRLRAEPPVLEVRDRRGLWVQAKDVGFPSGKDKTVVVDLAGIFPTRDHHVRIRTNLEVYWDQAFVAESRGVGGESYETVQPYGPTSHSPLAPGLMVLSPTAADLHYRGFSRMYRKGGRYGPHWFDYDSVSKRSPWRPITGAATRFGDVRPLLDAPDDEYVIMVPGDEMTVQFPAPSAPQAGWTRTFILYSDGWIKDSDLNTAYGTTIEPLPYHAIHAYPYAPGDAYPADSARRRYEREYNTRVIRSGAPAER